MFRDRDVQLCSVEARRGFTISKGASYFLYVMHRFYFVRPTLLIATANGIGEAWLLEARPKLGHPGGRPTIRGCSISKVNNSRRTSSVPASCFANPIIGPLRPAPIGAHVRAGVRLVIKEGRARQKDDCRRTRGRFAGRRRSRDFKERPRIEIRAHRFVQRKRPSTNQNEAAEGRHRCFAGQRLKGTAPSRRTDWPAFARLRVVATKTESAAGCDVAPHRRPAGLNFLLLTALSIPCSAEYIHAKAKSGALRRTPRTAAKPFWLDCIAQYAS